LAGLRVRLAERRITLQLSDGARTHLVRAGYDPRYGARPLKRAIQKQIETPIARMILAGSVKDGSAVEIGWRNGALTFDAHPGARAEEAAAAS
jgi:ATP-dependent Clp protease ATP-binding subunit ClpB